MLKTKDISVMIKFIIVLSVLTIIFFSITSKAQTNFPCGKYILDSFRVNDTTVVTAEQANWMLELVIPDDHNFTMTEIKNKQKQTTTEGTYQAAGNRVVMDKFLKMENAEIYQAFCTFTVNGDLLTIRVDSVKMNIITHSITEMFNYKQATPFFSDLYFKKQEAK
ncbi:MAG TPA: hypothetical protein PLP19_20440 [bacterium]|nr:hypothetical protein [bacterium]HPN45866.1 hypothetical protein [bacterium]